MTWGANCRNMRAYLHSEPIFGRTFDNRASSMYFGKSPESSPFSLRRTTGSPAAVSSRVAGRRPLAVGRVEHVEEDGQCVAQAILVNASDPAVGRDNGERAGRIVVDWVFEHLYQFGRSLGQGLRLERRAVASDKRGGKRRRTGAARQAGAREPVVGMANVKSEVGRAPLAGMSLGAARWEVVVVREGEMREGDVGLSLGRRLCAAGPPLVKGVVRRQSTPLRPVPGWAASRLRISSRGTVSVHARRSLALPESK
jgi:hypothetical protein